MPRRPLLAAVGVLLAAEFAGGPATAHRCDLFHGASSSGLRNPEAWALPRALQAAAHAVLAAPKPHAMLTIGSTPVLADIPVSATVAPPRISTSSSS